MIKFLLFSLLFPLLFFAPIELKAQCDDEMGVFNCAELLGGDTVIYLSDFTAKGKKKKTYNDVRFDWDVYLNKNTNYRFALCCSDGIADKELILYNEDFPIETPCASTFKDGLDNYFFDYHCLKDGLYNVCIKFKNEKNTKRLCAIGLLGYIGKSH
jgi:hypothetical protein